MSRHQNKYSRSPLNKDLLEKRKQQKREQIAKQKESQLKASIVLAIVAISVQAMSLILTFLPGDKGYIILPGLLGLLLGGMALGLVHTDKKKKTFVRFIFVLNVVVGIYSGVIFIKSQQAPAVTQEELEQLNTLQSTFQEKVRQQEIKDSLEQVKNQNIDSTLSQ